MEPLRQLAETRAYDKLFFEAGVEQEDIIYSFAMHNLDNNAEFKAMIADSKKQYEEQVQILLNKLAGPNGGGQAQAGRNPF